MFEHLEKPSEAMVAAGKEVPCDALLTGGVVYSSAEEAAAIYQAMLAQAKKEARL
jgi:hypothetical protein